MQAIHFGIAPQATFTHLPLIWLLMEFLVNLMSKCLIITKKIIYDNTTIKRN
jgi:hypothetical protein